MTWNTATPAGTDPISNGDDEIRTLKTDLQTALRGNATDGDEAKFPGSDTANPIYRYRGLKGTTAARPTAGQYGLYVNTTLNTIQRDNGSAWQDIATLIPSGTVMVFFQSAAPTGWTQNTSHNDKALRVVSGTGGGNGGSTAFTSCWAATSSGSTNLGTHTHTYNLLAGAVGAVPGTWGATQSQSTTDTADLGTHSHTVTSYAPHYIDVIVATKD